MRYIISLFLFFLIGCAPSYHITPKPISKYELQARIRVYYQQDLKNKDEVKINLREALYLMKQELNIEFLLIEEKDFEFKDSNYDDQLPIEIYQEFSLYEKKQACINQTIHDGAATLCIFENSINNNQRGTKGTILGVQFGDNLMVCNLPKVGFLNVVRHELGHLLGADHTNENGSDVMRPYMRDDGMSHLLPFSEITLKEIRKSLKPSLPNSDEKINLVH